MVVACASSRPPPPPPVAPTPEEHDASPEEPPPAPETATASVDAPERSAPPSTGSYEDALSTPERLDVNDDRVHLTDAQLSGPMRGVATGCRVPSNARITIKTAVQNGRAIGVTVIVRLERPKPAGAKPARPPSRAAARAAARAAKAEAKLIASITACVDRNVRAVVWPPSRRRDSFTTEL